MQRAEPVKNQAAAEHHLLPQPPTGGEGKGVERQTETEKEQPDFAIDTRPPLPKDSVIIYQRQVSDSSTDSASKPKQAHPKLVPKLHPDRQLDPPAACLPANISREPRGKFLFKRKVLVTCTC